MTSRDLCYEDNNKNGMRQVVVLEPAGSVLVIRQHSIGGIGPPTLINTSCSAHYHQLNRPVSTTINATCTSTASKTTTIAIPRNALLDTTTQCASDRNNRIVLVQSSSSGLPVSRYNMTWADFDCTCTKSLDAKGTLVSCI